MGTPDDTALKRKRQALPQERAKAQGPALVLARRTRKERQRLERPTTGRRSKRLDASDRRAPERCDLQSFRGGRVSLCLLIGKKRLNALFFLNFKPFCIVLRGIM